MEQLGKQGRCIWCEDKIPQGEFHYSFFGNFGGERHMIGPQCTPCLKKFSEDLKKANPSGIQVGRYEEVGRDEMGEPIWELVDDGSATQ